MALTREHMMNVINVNEIPHTRMKIALCLPFIASTSHSLTIKREPK